ncbi:MAG: phosphoenolpyruvate synthase, partial [Gammaproteobacteria bacterium]|nr:phosphoenolpyruvate synthase [Gammaproteobacteria bacterium]
MSDYIVALDQLGIKDIGEVGGKNASLGEMIQHLSGAGVLVPGGFATTATAYREFMRHDGLDDRIMTRLSELDVDDVGALTRAGREIRGWIGAATLQRPLLEAVEHAYAQMAGDANGEFSVAVRSSATAEDLPTASFAGQQETYLNVTGIDSVTGRIKDVFASLFNDRAIAYR